MSEKKIEKLLKELTDATKEPVRSGLSEDIKQQIPRKLTRHRSGLDTINIIIDLRVSKLTAAAAIIITIILCASFLGGSDSTDDGIFQIFQDAKMFIKYVVLRSGTGRGDLAAVRTRYENLLKNGKEAEYYGDNVDLEDSNSVLLQWKIADGQYMVMFADRRESQVSAEELIKLQVRMLQKRRND